MRIVLDTNDLISAFFWDGNERKLLRMCRKKKHQLVTSPQILVELTRVLLDKFDLPEGKVNEYQEEILLMSELILLTGEIDIIEEDPTDNIILETAVLGKATKIITGDKHLLKFKKYKGIEIIKSMEKR
ncbi:MAG: putative toxin-antitoxin system toxin component, PIN family [Thermoplasmata archaeon]